MFIILQVDKENDMEDVAVVSETHSRGQCSGAFLTLATKSPVLIPCHVLITKMTSASNHF